MNITINLYPSDKIENMSKYGGYTMDVNFIRFLEAAEEIRKMQDNRETLSEKIKSVHDAAMEHYNKIAETYKGSKQRNIDRMEKAEEENRYNKSKIVELTKKQIQAETEKQPFAGSEELARLKVEVASYPQTVEALDSLINGVVVPAADVEALEEYRREWQALNNDRKIIDEKIQVKLLEIQKNLIPFCMATFEIIPAMLEFMPQEVYKEWETMRKEPRNEE